MGKHSSEENNSEDKVVFFKRQYDNARISYLTYFILGISFNPISKMHQNKIIIFLKMPLQV